MPELPLKQQMLQRLDFEQPQHLARVRSKTAGAILRFFDDRAVGQDFTAQELRDYVAARVPGIAPASPDRILRDMRSRGEVSYEVISRKNSRYRKLDGSRSS